MRFRPQSSTDRRRDLRKPGTEAEVFLWQRLRDRQLEGWKFRRQHAVGPYIVDFYCVEAHLAVEVDGSQHLELRQIRYDEKRTEYLLARGIRVIRFSARDVLSEPASVADAILGALT